MVADLTKLGYSRYRCRDCGQRYNERTGTPFNFLEYPTDIVLLILFHYARYKLSYEDVAEIFWRRGKAGKRWHVDESYLQIDGQWCYIYRAIDKAGNLVDVYLSPKRDKASAIKFFQSAINVVGHLPKQITTDKNPAYPDAIKQTIGDNTEHRPHKYLNNYLEQDHRAIKSRYYTMKSFKDFFCALIFCRVFEEIRNFFKTNSRSADKLNSTDKRRILLNYYWLIRSLLVT